ncbi:unnamed protein product [Coregonus sp. 'balchen']|nr:unnamed protein product [Coregonus sp. 'balchen']
MLQSMHQLRLHSHLCDVTVQVAFHGELEEFEAHRLVLAASSGYFKNILLAPDPPKKIFLGNVRNTDFTRFLEYVYTGKLEVDKEFAKDKIGVIREVAILLECKSLIEACSSVLDEGSSSPHGAESSMSQDMEADLDDVEEEEEGLLGIGINKIPKRASTKRLTYPTRPERRERTLKRAKVTVTAKEERSEVNEDAEISGRRSNRLAGRRVFVDIPRKKYVRKMKDQTKTQTEDLPDNTQTKTTNQEEKTENTQKEAGEALPELLPEKEGAGLESTDVDDEEGDIPEDCPDDSLFFPSKEEMVEEGAPNRSSRRDTQYKTSHGVQGEVTYRCDTCQQTFANRCNLKIHQRHVHSDERLFPCDVCTKTFKRKKDVMRHRRQTHDQNTPWKNYLVVLKDNMEVKTKKPRCPGRKVKVENVVVGEVEGESGAGGRLQEGAMLVPGEPITLSANWGDPGTITLVSHTTLGGFTVIQTEIPAGTHLPIANTDGAGVISLDGSTVSVPFSVSSIPVMVSHSIPVSSSSSGPLPIQTVSLSCLSVPGAMFAPVSVTETSTISTPPVLETAVSQTILASDSEAGPGSEMTAIADPEEAVCPYL